MTANPTIRLLRDTDPEAKALGGWYVEIHEPKPNGEVLVHSTDYCFSKAGAIANGLALAFRVGLTFPHVDDGGFSKRPWGTN